MNSLTLQQAPKKLKLHQQRAADLRAILLLIRLGAGIRVDAPAVQPAVDAQPGVKNGGA